ncbi:MAG: helix-turn-helix transcriptional regulator [Bacilli bacterium]|nr:helix-turn-helix domain-containing protein [Acholeplasmataceae bacterium]MDY2903226.1 helix-turn-helix transcriptional regulator [Bacilli bacterium]
MRAMNLGKNIELLRKNFGVTQEELAMKLGLSRQAIYKWEKDKATPTIENIMKICELFDLDINDFLKGKINKRKAKK